VNIPNCHVKLLIPVSQKYPENPGRQSHVHVSNEIVKQKQTNRKQNKNKQTENKTKTNKQKTKQKTKIPIGFLLSDVMLSYKCFPRVNKMQSFVYKLVSSAVVKNVRS
jgi:hypothetical protein